MKFVTLMENTTCREDLCCEHGLSLYLETGDHIILFDAGQSGAFAENGEKMGVDLQKVDFAVLSHGHYDHGGGLARFLEINQKAPVYVSSYAFEPHYSANGYIGLDLQLQGREQIRPVAEETVLAEGITLYQLDVVPADTAGLEMEEAGKRVLISGCSHKGILQIMEAFRPDILVGGFHFMKITEEETLRQAAEKLLEYDTVYYTGHCTGQTQYAYLKEIMGEQLHYIAAGTTVVL